MASCGNESVEVPEDLNSYEFLLFAGFIEETARQIYQGWIGADQTIGSYLVSFARGYIRGRAMNNNAINLNDDWNRALIEMGVNDRLREAILDPEYDPVVRATRSASFWVIDTINEIYFFLETLSKTMEASMSELTEMRHTIHQRPEASQLVLQSKAIQDQIGQMCKGFAWVTEVAPA